MRDIKIGEYIRTIQGTIAEIEDKDDITINGLNEVCYKKWVEDFGGSYRELERIVKHSNNLIDLIEAGDFLNGYCVEYINNSGNEIENKDIKTILTHEQYERNIYRVKESN